MDRRGGGKITSLKIETKIFKHDYWKWSVNSTNGPRFMAKAKYLKKKRPPRPPKNYAMTILENLKIGKSYFLKKNNAPNQNDLA